MGRSAPSNTPKPIVGAFAPMHVLDQMDPKDRQKMVQHLSQAGVTHLLTEGTACPHGLEDQLCAAGLRVGGGLACFSDHAETIQPALDHLRPIGPTGSPRPRMEWYHGIIPTDRDYEDALVRACRDLVTKSTMDVFILDFIRWPLHWELELRDDTKVADSSFDPITLHRFRDEMNIDIPIKDPVTAAARIQSGFVPEWTTFKCQVITLLVERITGELRQISPHVRIGAFVVPGSEAERRRHAGQDIAAMAKHLDLLLPMTYHAILHRRPRWVFDMVSDIKDRVKVPVAPVLQATADPSVAGPNDWGLPFPPAEFGEAIDAGLDAGGYGFVAFPAHALNSPHLAEISSRASRVSN